MKIVRKEYPKLIRILEEIATVPCPSWIVPEDVFQTIKIN